MNICKKALNVQRVRNVIDMTYTYFKYYRNNNEILSSRIFLIFYHLKNEKKNIDDYIKDIT